MSDVIMTQPALELVDIYNLLEKILQDTSSLRFDRQVLAGVVELTFHFMLTRDMVLNLMLHQFDQLDQWDMAGILSAIRGEPVTISSNEEEALRDGPACFKNYIEYISDKHRDIRTTVPLFPNNVSAYVPATLHRHLRAFTTCSLGVFDNPACAMRTIV